MLSLRKPAVLAVCLLAAAAAAALAAGQTGVSPAMKKAMRHPTDPVVRMTTTLGDITLELYKQEAPKTVENFLAYTRKKHYDGTVFHRVIGNFMIQGGGYGQDLSEKPTAAPIVNEAGNGLSNEVGTIAMARTNDPNSATAQFFINVKGNKSLDKNPGSAGYAVFGKVIGGMEVVDLIKKVRTAPKGMHENIPVVPVVIKSVVVLQ